MTSIQVQSLHGVPCDFIGNQQHVILSSKYVITG